MTSRSSVATARTLPFPSGSSRFFAISRASTRSSPRIATGETRKRSRIVRGWPAGGRAAKSRRISKFRRTMLLLAASSASLAGSSSSSAGSTWMPAPASSPISWSSVEVHAACTGPRRPRTWISRSADPAIASIAASVVSVGASSSRVSASIRATSSATFPLPTTTARSPERSNASSWKSGWPLYQATSSVAAHEPGRSSPGIPSLRSACDPTA